MIAAAPHAVAHRPHTTNARAAIHTVFDGYADATGQTIIFGACTPVGRVSRACMIRIVGNGPQRLRVVVTDMGRSYNVSASKAAS
jgi:hypothetical protein